MPRTATRRGGMLNLLVNIVLLAGVWVIVLGNGTTKFTQSDGQSAQFAQPVAYAQTVTGGDPGPPNNVYSLGKSLVVVTDGESPTNYYDPNEWAKVNAGLGYVADRCAITSTSIINTTVIGGGIAYPQVKVLLTVPDSGCLNGPRRY